MSKIFAFHQPNYLPNLSFFYKMAKCDLFIITTNVQFVRREWHNRVKIPIQDHDHYLSIPVRGSNRQMLREAKIESCTRWARKHVRTLTANYSKTAEKSFFDKLRSFYEHPADRLVDFNIALIELIKNELHISTPVVVDEEVNGKQHELLINLCRKYGIRKYLSGLGGKDYMDNRYLQELQKHGITHEFVDRNITAECPYSSVHYMLTEDIDEVCEIVNGEAH